MKKTSSLLAVAVATGAFFNTSFVLAGDGGNVLGGMITGALIGSVFGPNKHVRGQNALIGAVGGAFLGSQMGSSQDSSDNSGWYGNAYPNRTTTIIHEEPQPQTVIFTPRREIETVVVDQYSHETVYVEPQQETVTYIQTERVPYYNGHHHYKVVGYDVDGGDDEYGDY